MSTNRVDRSAAGPQATVSAAAKIIRFIPFSLASCRGTVPPDGTSGCVAVIIPPAGGAGTRYVNGRRRPVIPSGSATSGDDRSCDERKREPAIGIGDGHEAVPLPHHPACGSAPGGSGS